MQPRTYTVNTRAALIFPHQQPTNMGMVQN